MTMKAALGILVPALLIAGCNKTPGKDDVELTNASVAEANAAAEKVETITPGQWTVTTEITDVRLPAMEGEDRQMADAMTQQMKGRTQTQTSCVTPEQARGPNSTLIGGTNNGACSFESFSLLRGALNAVLTCRKEGNPGQMVIATSGTYGGDKVDLETVMRVEETLDQPKDKALRIVSTVTGRRIGDCPAKTGSSK
jgi:uncharacterized ParB-like nuclease family protein